MMLCETRSEINSDREIYWNEEDASPESFGENIQVYGQASYLNALIAGSSHGGRFLFPRIEFQGKCIAYGCFQELILYREDLDEMGRLFSSESKLMLRIESLFKLLVQLGNGKKGIRILIAGNSQVSGYLGLFFSNEITPAMQADCWKHVLESADNQYGPYAIVLAKEFAVLQQPEIIKKMKSAGFRKVSSLPVMMMQIPSAWDSFEDYLKAMSAKYRIRAKAARKKASGVISSSWGTDEIKRHISQIGQLYLNVYSKARFRLMRIDPVYFIQLKQNLGDRFRFEAYHSNEQFIGFRTSIQNGSSLDAHLIGLDYEANKEHSLYINMLYDYIQHALENKFTKIDFGRTAMEIKSTVGAVPVDFVPLVKIRNPLLNGLSCVLMENTAPEIWVQRHPFKE
jgi:hypothetical protein